ncbi:MAG: hypothetical protein JW929_00530 [Anaerolineales bacterium]|nr:hypothetical protein [Anaerolineales bacterium]
MPGKKNADNTFVEALDTVFQIRNPDRDARRVSRLLTGSILYSRGLAFSDTMLIDNLGLRRLFRKNSAFRELISQIGVAGIRNGSDNLLSVVEKQIKSGMIFSSFPEQLRNKVKNNKLDEVTITPDEVFSKEPEYYRYIEALDNALNRTNNKFTASWEVYETVLKRLIDKEKLQLADKGAIYILDGLIDRTRIYAASKGRKRIDRSDYYKVVRQGIGLEYPGPDNSQQIVIEFFVDRAYRENFWMNNNVSIVSFTSKKGAELFKSAFPEREKMLRYMDLNNSKIIKLPSIEIDTKAIISLDQLDFDFHIGLREENISLDYLDTIYKAEDDGEAKTVLREYWLYIDSKIAEYYKKKKKPQLLKNGKMAIEIVAITAEGLNLYSALRAYQQLSPNLTILLSAAGAVLIVELVKTLYGKIEETERDKQTKTEQDLKKYFRDVIIEDE